MYYIQIKALKVLTGTISSGYNMSVGCYRTTRTKPSLSSFKTCLLLLYSEWHVAVVVL